MASYLYNLRKKEDGFTLLEVLISISLLVIVIALAGTAVRLGINSILSGENKIEKMERFRSAINIITYQINSQIPISDEKDAMKKIVFSGSKNFLQFPTGYSIWDGLHGYVLVDYQVIQEENGQVSLKASEKRIGTGKIQETILFSKTDHISFEYSIKKDILGEEEWVEEWQDHKKTPEKIKLNLKYDGDKYSFIFPLLARKISK
jgi:general secretion pathway protein J